MSVDVEVERSKFELWITVNAAPHNLHRLDRDNGLYALRWVQDSFEGWLAAKRDAEQEK